MSPELANGIKKSEWFTDNLGHMPVCLFMLLPYSGRSTGKLGDDDPNVVEVGEIEIIINNRNYSPKVCKVTERDKNGQVKSVSKMVLLIILTGIERSSIFYHFASSMGPIIANNWLDFGIIANNWLDFGIIANYWLHFGLLLTIGYTSDCKNLTLVILMLYCHELI